MLTALGVPSKGGGLPARARCPVCAGSLTVYDDTKIGAVYHQCSGCGSKGDMIALAARTWNIDPAAALERLALQGVLVPHAPGVIASYTTAAARQAVIDSIWEDAKTYLASGDGRDLMRIQQVIGVANHVGVTQWRAGPGKFIGGLPAGDFRRRLGHHQLKDLGMGGGGWGEIALTAYEAVPGRICGFFCVGRGCEPLDRVYVRAVRNGEHIYDAGLAGREALAKVGPTCGPYVMAVGDPFFAACLQARHAVDSDRPLPLVAFHVGPGAITSAASWRTITDRTPVLWGWRLTPELLHQAILANGCLSWAPKAEHPTEKRLAHYVRDHTALAIVRRAIAGAKPWQIALANWAETVEDGAIEALLAGLDQITPGLRPTVAVSDKIRRLAIPPDRPRAVMLGKYQMVEQNGRTYAVDCKNSKTMLAPYTLILDALLRLDGIRQGQGDKYVGRLIYRGKTIPFALRVHGQYKFREGLIAAVAKAVPGAILYMHPSWKQRLIAASLLMNPPADP